MKVIEAYETHVSEALMLHKHKNLVVDVVARYKVFKNSNFTDWFMVLIVVRRCPYRWPTS